MPPRKPTSGTKTIVQHDDKIDLSWDVAHRNSDGIDLSTAIITFILACLGLAEADIQIRV